MSCLCGLRVYKWQIIITYIYIYIFALRIFGLVSNIGMLDFCFFQLMFELHFSAHIDNVCSLTSFFFYTQLSISATFCKRRWVILSSHEPTKVQILKLKLKLCRKYQKCILVIALNPKVLYIMRVLTAQLNRT